MEAIEILLVEDDPRDARLTVRELESANLKNKIEVARDGEEALDFLFCRGAYSHRSIGHPPALVLLDLKLPKSGWTAGPEGNQRKPGDEIHPRRGIDLVQGREGHGAELPVGRE